MIPLFPTKRMKKPPEYHDPMCKNGKYQKQVPDCFPAQNITNAPAHLCTGTFSVIGKKDQYRTQPYLFRAPFVLLTSCVSSVLSVLFTLPSPLISAAR